MTDKPDRYVYRYITKVRVERYIQQGKCPVCHLLLTSMYHTDCPFLDEKSEIVDKKNESMG